MARNEFQHPLFGRVFARLVMTMDRRGGERHRRLLLAGLHGRVVEVGAGSGANFGYYPDTVTEVVAVEPDDYLRAKAQDAARRAAVHVRVEAGDASDLPGLDGEYDAIVMSLVLCSVSDPPAALEEARRVLDPRGELRFYEHVRSTGARVSSIQDALTPGWQRVAGGCHPNRDTLATMTSAGWQVTSADLSPSWSLVPHVLGSAHL